MTKGYVLMQRAYEYNDEYYVSSEGGYSKQIYFNENEAEAACDSRNLQFMRGLRYTEYGGYLDDSLELILSTEDIRNEQLPDDLTSDQAKELMDALYIHMWYVEEVEVIE